jgi:NADPH:quinone reductase-like Zn-dependent oxidoreductase
MRRRDPALIERVVAGLVAGDLKWLVSAEYPFEDALSAYRAILARHVRGKSVLTF